MTTADADRRKALTAILAHAPFDGWTDRCLRQAARDSGLTFDQVKLLFPRGGVDAIAFFLEEVDRDMVNKAEGLDLAAMKIRERITALVRMRITALTPHREAARRAALTLSLPNNAGTAARSLSRTVDLMWRLAGDSSTDWNYYSKRAILSGVYTSTLLVWYADHSDNFEETWAFLDRRIADVMKIEKTKVECRKALEKLPDIPGMLGRLRHRANRPYGS